MTRQWYPRTYHRNHLRAVIIVTDEGLRIRASDLVLAAHCHLS